MMRPAAAAPTCSSARHRFLAAAPAWTAAAAARRHCCTQRAASRSSSTSTSTTSSSSDGPLLIEERGVRFTPGDAFYRAESAQGRDLAVLAAAVHKRRTGRLTVLDVMAGSGMRGARYLLQAQADLVWCNDHDRRTHDTLCNNLVSVLQQQQQQGQDDGDIAEGVQALERAARRLQYPGLRGDVLQWSSSSSSSSIAEQECRVSHVDANRLLASVYLQEEFFDVVDVDSFGSDISFLPLALDAVRFGGLLFLTSTDGLTSGGKRPQRSLAAYGAHLRPLPHANEQGLRALIGAAVREGAAKGLNLRPLFSLFSFHGPVFRVMLQVTRSGCDLERQYGFVGHCWHHGDSYNVNWRALSQAWCRCKPAAPLAVGTAAAPHPTPLVLSGPQWTGPLHDTAFVQAMSNLAAEWGWRGSAVPDGSPHAVRQSKNNSQRPLESLLELLLAESHPALPPWYLCIDTLALHLSTTPGRDKLIAALQARGFLACLCHIERRALRTNATTQEVLRVAVEDCGCQYRLPGQPGVPPSLLQQHQLLP